MTLKISSFKRIVVLTGAGISAESGIRTFRDSDGLWENHRIEDVATPEAFERDPVLVWRFYSMRRADAARAQPNAAHRALARFARSAIAAGVEFQLITQNVDDLHQRACAEETGEAPAPLAMHGTLSQSRCVACEKIWPDSTVWLPATIGPGSATPLAAAPPFERDSTAPSALPHGRDPRGLPLSPCCRTLLRPHIVWFGEMPLFMTQIEKSLTSCELFVTIGTSGVVYPAAGFLSMAKIAGAKTVCLNREPLPQKAMIDFFIEGPASQTVPAFFNRID